MPDDAGRPGDRFTIHAEARGVSMRICVLVLLTCVVTAAPGAAQDGRRVLPEFSVFVGGGWTDLAGPESEGGRLGLNTLGAAAEGRLNRALSLRAELLAAVAAAMITERGMLQRRGHIARGDVGVAGMIRGYAGERTQGRPFAAIGGALATQTFCDVDLVGGVGFLGGETVACADWDGGLRTTANSAAAIVAAGAVHRRWGGELRYRHGLQPVITSPRGELHARSIALVLHYRFSRGPQVEQPPGR
jgi:hypothetical protein